MAPRAPKTKGDDDEPLKPKAEKAKVTKTKSEKTDKPDKSKKDVKEKEKGDKIKPVTGDEAMELIEEYLRTQNRPYSATEVSANLHGKVSPCILS
jgi:26S proteasome regulatory subunit (ATPase 3-interacting protein)